MKACNTKIDMAFEEICSTDKKEFCENKLAQYIDSNYRNFLIFDNWLKLAHQRKLAFLAPFHYCQLC
jgi:hypothetical protein